MTEDRSWMRLPRRLPEFENGLVNFLNASFAKASRGNQIRCPCKQCKNRYWCHRSEVYDHLKVDGFVDDYEIWSFHGEDHVSMGQVDVMEEDNFVMHDSIDELMHDRFRETIVGAGNSQGPNEEARKFHRLVEEGNQELFPGCKTFSKLSFIIRLLLYKTLHGLSNVAFDDLLKLWKEVIPNANLPSNFNEAKKIIRDLGLDYQKIHACPNDYMLYWKEYEDAEECYVCHTSKWKQPEENQGNGIAKPSKKKSRIPAKVLWHFPLKPRLQRLFMCSQTAQSMAWHADEREEDGNLRHPADGLTWKSFDSLYPNFSKDSRNVRLGLASDGFSNNIDVYMQPLKEELLDLWNNGVQTYDKYNDQTFQLHAALMWTISDFPGSKKAFNGKEEQRPPPKPLTGIEIHSELLNFENSFGKTVRRRNDPQYPWKKRPWFFDLPYWKDISCRHNLDVMHIEKNLCDNLLGTLLDIKGKTKDHAKGRFDLMDLGFKEELHRQLADDGKHVFFKKGSFSMSPQEKDIFCRALKEAKLPYGCASNIARCVRSSERKVVGYKSHDAHIILHYLLQVVVRKSLPKHVAIPLIRLGAFFRKLCGKVIDPKDLDSLQTEITETLCELEKIFVPSFFDIMSYVRNRSHPEGSMAEGYWLDECSNFLAWYMQGVKSTHSNEDKKVHQVWYAPDPINSRLNYVMNAIPRDIYDFGEGEEVAHSNRCVPEDNGSTSLVSIDDTEINLSREDIEPMVMDANVTLDGVATDEQNREDSDFDDTVWDWMEADEDFDNVAE
ncbi:uncharacterized protein LOC130589685 [Beta vulgaris subsp. vulgaris]|uniref:uncharacterized protein LOC130589685 n=1 Tax=Beta vulgaris subsp. vulgaris TaxID=3555 RepID=UPI00254998A2|nr:uncharacterized protein LOC130589685 [Beta vulgaris subsp. vulgaris]